MFYKKLSNKDVLLFIISSFKLFFNFFTVFSKQFFFIFLRLSIYKIPNRLYSLLFVSCLFFLLCSIRFMVFHLSTALYVVALISLMSLLQLLLLHVMFSNC